MRDKASQRCGGGRYAYKRSMPSGPRPEKALIGRLGPPFGRGSPAGLDDNGPAGGRVKFRL